MTHDLEANKRNAIDFYRTAYLGDPGAAVERFVGDEAPHFLAAKSTLTFSFFGGGFDAELPVGLGLGAALSMVVER